VPGQANNPKSQGTLNLLKQGAAIATSADDILEAMGWQVNSPVKNPIEVNLEPEERKICDVVGMGPAHFDELVRQLGYSPSKVSSILLKLELSGLIVRRPGNFVARV
jgi:DNA processing protein